MRGLGLRIFLVTALVVALAPAKAVADQVAPDGPCKSVPSTADHCDWDGQNDVLENHRPSDDHANINSDCNARLCEPSPSPSPSPSSSPSPTVEPTPEASVTTPPEPAVPDPGTAEPKSVAVPARATAVLPATIPAKAVLPAKIPSRAVLPARVEGGR